MYLKNKRIFIVEDNLNNRAVMQLILEQFGAKIAVERWGTDTVNRMRAFMPIDVVLLDLMFPNNITGYDIFDQIRGVAEFANIPIVAVSASEPAVAVPKTRGKGFAGFISKPIEYDLFPQQIAKVLAGEQVWFVV